jgi:hypothetical protein
MQGCENNCICVIVSAITGIYTERSGHSLLRLIKKTQLLQTAPRLMSLLRERGVVFMQNLTITAVQSVTRFNAFARCALIAAQGIKQSLSKARSNLPAGICEQLNLEL